jgi:hypothetical protein
LIQGQAEFRTKHTDWERSNVTSQGPPEEKGIDNGRGLLVFLMDAIDTLSFSRPDHFLGVAIHRRLKSWGRISFGIVALRLHIVRVLDIVRVPHISLVAVNEVRHCCEIEK